MTRPARPDDLPSWATAPTIEPEGTATTTATDVIKPSSAFAALGWQKAAPRGPVRQYMNWLHRITGAWIDRLRYSLMTHETLTDAAADLEDGESGLVIGDRSVEAFAPDTPVYNAGTTLRTVWSDGDALFFAGDNPGGSGHNVFRYSRSSSTTAVWSVAIAGTCRAIRCLGGSVFVAATDAVYALNRSTGALVWTVALAVEARAIAATSVYVYWAGDALSGTGYTLQRMNYSSGAVLSSYAHGATMRAVVANESAVFAGGEVGSGSYSLRRFSTSLSVEKEALGTDAVLGLALDRTRLYAVTDGDDLICMNHDLDVIWTVSSGVSSPTAVAVDDEFVWVTHGATGFVSCYDKSGVLVRTTAAHGAALHAVDSDGEKVFAVGAIASSRTARQWLRPFRARVFTRFATNASNRVFYKLLEPEG